MVSVTGTKNFTNRKKLFYVGIDPDITIKVSKKNNNDSVFDASINIKNPSSRNFPTESKITLVAYTKRGFLSQPYNCGNIGNQKSLSNIVIPQVSPESLKFDLRVSDNDYLLGLAEKISPPDPDKDDSDFLGVQEDDIDEIFDVNIEPNLAPILVVKRGLDIKFNLKNNPVYQALIYPATLRIILYRYLFQIKEFEGCKFKKAYINKFSEYMGNDEDINKENDESAKIDWINKCIQNFCTIENKSKISILTSFKNSIENEKQLKDKDEY